MIAYLAIVSARFRSLLQYRAAAAAGLGTQLFWGLIRLMIYSAFFRSTTQPQPMSYPQTVTYIWLGQAFFALLPFNTDADIRVMIRSGTVAYEMLRPIDLYGLWYCRALAMRTAPTLLRAVPMFILAGLFFGLRLPPSWESGLAWVGVTFGAVLLAAAVSTLLTITLLWTISGDGIVRIMTALIYLLSGIMLPLAFFPDWLQPLLRFLPFGGIMDAPFRVYSGNIPASQFGAVFGHQLVWIVALILIGRALLAQGTRRLVVQGG
jgi:ABC-2 type transport system permease protein